MVKLPRPVRSSTSAGSMSLMRSSMIGFTAEVYDAFTDPRTAIGRSGVVLVWSGLYHDMRERFGKCFGEHLRSLYTGFAVLH